MTSATQGKILRHNRVSSLYQTLLTLHRSNYSNFYYKGKLFVCPSQVLMQFYEQMSKPLFYRSSRLLLSYLNYLSGISSHPTARMIQNFIKNILDLKIFSSEHITNTKHVQCITRVIYC